MRIAGSANNQKLITRADLARSITSSIYVEVRTYKRKLHHKYSVQNKDLKNILLNREAIYGKIFLD